MSEFSTSSNQRPSKRVSFQNDVLIFQDGNVQTYNNGLEKGKSPAEKMFDVREDREEQREESRHRDHVYREEDGTRIKLVPVSEEVKDEVESYKSPPYYECCIIKNVDVIKNSDVIKNVDVVKNEDVVTNSDVAVNKNLHPRENINQNLLTVSKKVCLF